MRMVEYTVNKGKINFTHKVKPMLETKYQWRNRQIREHVEVLEGKRSPTILLYNATYLHAILKQWVKGNIWIYQDRIVYAGEKMPEFVDGQCEIVDCENMLLVPGYFEPHAHPFQLYNPLTFSFYASSFGTTILINDNLPLVLNLNRRQGFMFLGRMDRLPVSMYWWSRFDGQTEIWSQDRTFSNSNVKAWLEHRQVVQGGELTGWPKLMDGDDLLLHWIQETKRLNKRVEGHFPGASEKTLSKLKLLGVDGDHEAMTGEEVKRRMMLGYTVTLRYSSIRPDLPNILEEIKTLGIQSYDSFLLTTDGSPPAFYEAGVVDRLIKIAIEKEVPPIDAYLMATWNPARHFHLEHLYGLIATGRVANINFLENEDNPRPVSVLSKGQWIKKNNKLELDLKDFTEDMEEYFPPLSIDWELSLDDMQFSMPFGIKMENAVITKPYSITIDLNVEEISGGTDECFLMYLDRKGKFRINTLLKGFAKNLDGFATSFNNSGDLILIGKSKQNMLKAFRRMKELGGGIVLAEDDEIIFELPLPIGGMFSDLPMEDLIEKEKELRNLLFERGYSFDDPVYTMLFLPSTHLPYIRITPVGIFDVMKKRVLFPAIMR